MPAECDALQDVNPQTACFQELVMQYMSAQCIPASQWTSHQFNGDLSIDVIL